MVFRVPLSRSPSCPPPVPSKESRQKIRRSRYNLGRSKTRIWLGVSSATAPKRGIHIVFPLLYCIQLTSFPAAASGWNISLSFSSLRIKVNLRVATQHVCTIKISPGRLRLLLVLIPTYRYYNPGPNSVLKMTWKDNSDELSDQQPVKIEKQPISHIAWWSFSVRGGYPSV